MNALLFKSVPETVIDLKPPFDSDSSEPSHHDVCHVTASAIGSHAGAVPKPLMTYDATGKRKTSSYCTIAEYERARKACGLHPSPIKNVLHKWPYNVDCNLLVSQSAGESRMPVRDSDSGVSARLGRGSRSYPSLSQSRHGPDSDASESYSESDTRSVGFSCRCHDDHDLMLYEPAPKHVIMMSRYMVPAADVLAKVPVVPALR